MFPVLSGEGVSSNGKRYQQSKYEIAASEGF